MLQVQTFIDDPCPASQVDPRLTPNPCLQTKCGLRVWLHVTMYLKAYSERAKAYVLQLHTSYNVITRQNTNTVYLKDRMLFFNKLDV